MRWCLTVRDAQVQAPAGTNPEAIWQTATEPLTLAGNDVHVWRVDLSCPWESLLGLRRTLSADELARAKRFRFARDRQRFIVARGALRDILSRYLHATPEWLSFDTSLNGKPLLSGQGDEAAAGLDFNVSHSGDLALVAVARGRHVGVDIERITRDVDRELISGHSFSAEEHAQLQALPEHLRALGFFHCWTRKEAYVKARGEGLSLRLDWVQVSLVPGEPARLLRDGHDPEAPSRWTLIELHPGLDYVGALAVEGSGAQLRCWQWALKAS
jgi:4'-phosphopantetheinyl transferase